MGRLNRFHSPLGIPVITILMKSLFLQFYPVSENQILKTRDSYTKWISRYLYVILLEWLSKRRSAYVARRSRRRIRDVAKFVTTKFPRRRYEWEGNEQVAHFYCEDGSAGSPNRLYPQHAFRSYQFWISVGTRAVLTETAGCCSAPPGKSHCNT